MSKHDAHTDKETRKLTGSAAHIPDKSFKSAGANVVGTRLPSGGKPKGMKKGYK